MLLIYGSGLLLAALMLLGVARAIFARLDSEAGEPDFGPTEVMGFVITTLLAAGISFHVQAILADPGMATIAPVAASIGAVGAMAALAWRLLTRIARARGDASALPGGRPVRRGPGASGRPGEAPRRKRAA
ncbi:MAG: hypothetical protein RQ752_03025 [Thermohalobaculum sp.]|nr:hypothetical protein [Thermohalobaculum sp.]